jgi:Fic family protein
VEFEMIHPYLDGNGRIGRLLVALLLEGWGLLDKPLLPLSLFFERRRDEYDRRVREVSTDGDWESWIAFFLEGVATIANEALGTARELFALVESDRATLLAAEPTSIVALRLFERLPRHPVVTVASVMKLESTTKPTAGRAIELLQASGVLVETTGRRRDRAFAYRRYLELLWAPPPMGAAPASLARISLARMQ